MPRNILIDPQRLGTANPNIQFSGSMSNTIRLEVLASGSVQFTGISGSLLGISDNLSGSLFAVSDVSGLPIMEVFSDDTVVAGAYNTNALVVTGSRVGIGSRTPGYTLDVAPTTSTARIGTALVGSWPTSTSYAFFGHNSLTQTSNGNYALAQSNGGSTFVNASSGNSLSLRINDTAALTVDSSRNIGIGTATVSSKLHVYGGDILLLDAAVNTDATTLKGYSVGDGGFWVINNPTGGAGSKITLGSSFDWDRGTSILYSPGTTGAAAGILSIGQLQKNNASWTHGVTRFYTNGTERMRIDSSGNVGIGTAPIGIFDVYGAGTVGYIRSSNGTAGQLAFRNTNATTGLYVGIAGNSSGDGIVVHADLKPLWFGTNNTERMRIDSSGNVGIGTNNTNGNRVAISGGNLSVTGSLLPGDNATSYDLGSATYRWRTLFAANISGSLTPAGATAGSVFFAGDSGQISQDNANLFWDDANNRLGIRTSSPLYPLDVSGDSYLRSIVYVGSGQAIRNIGGAGSAYFMDLGRATFRDGTGANLGGILEASSLYVGTTYWGTALSNGSAAFAGSVGIGTTNPDAKLTLSGSSDLATFYNSSGTKQLTIQNSGDLSFSTSTNLGLVWGNASLKFNGQLNGVQVVPFSSAYVGFSVTGKSSQTYALQTWQNSAGTVLSVVDANGSVGLGITTVSSPLTTRLIVSGSSTSSAQTMLVKAGVASPTGPILEVENSDGATLLIVSGSGFVGISTAAPVVNSVKLQVGNATSLAQVTSMVVGGGADKAPVFSLLNSGNREGYIGQSTTALYIGNSSGLGGSYTDSNLASNAHVTISTGGLVGIGSTTPTAKLHVSDTSSGTTAILRNSDSGATLPTRTFLQMQGLYNNGNNGHQLHFHSTAESGVWEFNITKDWGGIVTIGASTDGTSRVRHLTVKDTGNVGVGTTNPSARLFVTGSSTASTSTVIIREGAANPTGGAEILDVQNYLGTSVMVVSGSGNVGIGMTSPTARIHVYSSNVPGRGQIVVDSPNGDNSQITFYSGGTTNTGRLLANSSGLLVGTTTATYLSLETWSAERIRIDSLGNVGIGTNNTNGNRVAITGGSLSVTGSVLPGATASYDLGSATYRWAELYARTGSFSGDVSIAGNLTVLGVQTYVSSTVVDIGDNIITLNSTANPQRYGGLYVNDTTANTTGSLLWDSDNNYWVAGLKGSEAILPTGTGTTNYITKWGTASTLTNSTIFDNGTNVAIGINAANSVGLTVYNSGIPTVSIKNSTSGNGVSDGLQISLSGTDSYVWNYEAGAIRFGTNATERLVIDSSGNVGVGTTFPMGGLDLRKLDIQHNGYTTAVVDLLAVGLTTGSFRYEIARVGIDYNDWNQVGSIEVELLERYWGLGSRKKYIVWYGYTSNSGAYLTEVSGPENATNMNNYQLTIGSEVSVVGDQRYIPIYVDVQYYTSITAVIRTNRVITATNPPPVGMMWINKSPSGVSLTPAFTPSTYVYLNNIGGYSSVFKYGYVGIGSSTPALALDILHSVPQIRVKGTSTTTEVRLNSSWAGTALGAVGTVDAGPFMIYTSNSERVRFDTSGNVGIGSTTTSGVRLHVSDNQSSATARFQLANVNANGGPLRIGYFPDSSGFHITANGNPSHTNIASNTVTRDYTNRAAFEMLNVLGSTLAGSYFDFRYSQSTTFSPTMRFQGDGKVGIGTTTFSSTETVAALEVSGSVYIQQNTDNDIKKLQFISNVSNTSLASFESKRLANYGSEFRLQIGRSAGGTGAQNVWKSRIYDDPTTYPNQNTHTTFNMTDTGGSNSNGVDATAVVYIGNGSNAGNTRPSLYATNDAYFAVSRGGVGIGTTVTNGNVLAITGSTAITGSVLPGVDNFYDLGSASKRWANLYVNNLTFASVTALLTGSNLSNGSVLFANATGGITGSQTQLFWNNTNNRLGIGNSTPNNPLTVVGNVDFRQSTASGNYLQFVPGTSYALISSNVGIEITAGGNYFVADANGYLFRNTAGSINNAFIDSSTGNVGVGSTTTLTARLQVSGSSTASTSTMLVREGVASPTGGALAFEVEKSNGSTIFAVSGSGFVGIGTSIPNATFEVVGVSGSLFSVTDQLSGSLFSVNTISGLPILEVFSDNTVVAGAYNSNALVVTGSRVGIATNNPDQQLDVRGNIGFGRRAQATVTRYVGLTNTDGNFSSTGGTGTTGIIIDQHSGGDTSVRFKTGAWGVSEDIRMSIDRVGNVGIGTTVATNASYAFSAGGGLSIYNGTQATIRLSAPSSNWDIGSNNNSLYFYDATNTSERMRIDGSGYVYIGGVSTRLASEVVRIGKASTQNSILLNNTAVDNAAIVGVFNDAAALAVNRNTSTGGFVNTGKYAAEVYAVGSASTSYVSIATAAAANTTPTERLRVDASGNLTIGPAVGTTAQSLIHLMTTATGDVPRITFTNATTGHTSGDGAFVGIANNTQLCVWNKESSDILFAANNTERMRIDAAGNVGIGTNNTNSNRVAISGGNLSVSGSVLPGDNATSYDLGSTTYRWRTIFAANISGSLTPTGATEGSVFFAGASGQIAQNNANFFWDNTNGRLGIGTSSPGQKLDVIGNVRASSTLLADTGATIGTNSLASLLSVIANAAAGQYKGFGFQSAGSYRWYFTSNNTAEGGSNAGSDLEVRAYADAGTYLSSPLLIKRSTGNVGINTTSPGSKLTINTDFASIAGITVDTGNASDSAIVMRKASNKPALALIPWDSQIFISAGTYEDGGSWVHNSDSTNSNIFTMTPGTGVLWYASSNSSVSWNVTNGVTLWDDNARWKSSVQSTRAENSYFTGGSVGIGTSTIVAYSGYTVLDIDSTTNGGLLNLKKNGSTVGYINAVSGLQVLAASGNNMYLTVAGANALYIRTNATDRMLVDSSGNLTPYLDNTYNLGSSTLRWANVHAVNIISSGSLGPAYTSPSSTSGGTAIYDTVSVTTNGAVYELMVMGNPNLGGSSGYMDVIYGKVIIGTGWNGVAVTSYIQFVNESPSPRSLYPSGGGPLTVDVVYFQSSAERTDVAAGSAATIRVKVSGYVNNTGYNTTVRLKQLV